jgi:hypothetical protein
MARSTSAPVAEGDGYILRRGRSRSGAKRMLELVWEDEVDWAPYFDAAWLVTEILNAVLEHHHRSIVAGVEAGTGLDQKPLEGKSAADADAGKRPDVRGWTGKSGGRAFPDALTRTKIAGSGVTKGKVKTLAGKQVMEASGTIKPGLSKHIDWLEDELGKRGVDYFYVDGNVEKLIEETLRRLIDQAIQAPPKRFPTQEEIAAKAVFAERSEFRPRGKL